jgi:D-alanyl-D-alanine carboxypeptidase (penicillin-binding protein 5/6)
MILSRRFLWLVLVALLGPAVAFAANSRANPSRPAAMDNATAYKGAILMDATTGKVLFEDRADVVSPPASMAKLMTFAVLHDKLMAGVFTLATPVKITPEDARMGGTQVYLDPRETFSIEELIYAMMIQSANDAAHALARTAGGSVAAFVDLMNAKARELGMTHTTFRTPHGLPPASRRTAEGDLTTPRDFALLSRHLLQKTDATKYTSIRLRPFGTGVRQELVAMKNHNNLLGKVGGIDGLKTGYTAGAGFCLSATAQRDSRRVIVVMMGSPESKVRDLKVTELIERGFAALPAGSPAAPMAAASPIAPAQPAVGKAAAGASAKPAAAGAAAADAGPTIKFSIPKK